MEELLKLAERFQSLGVVGVMAVLGYFIVRYLTAEIDRLQKLHAGVVAELRVSQEKRLEDSVDWAEKYREASVRDEAAAQILSKTMGEQAVAFTKLADKIR